MVRALLALVLCLPLWVGCGESIRDELTPEEIAKQQAEDKQRSEDEDKAEREFQRKLRQQGS